MPNVAGCPKPLFLWMVLALSHGLVASGQPNAAFVPDKTGGCPPLIVHFVNRTTGASGNAVYKWDLGNGNSSALDSAQAVYTDPGIYTVRLTVQDGGRMTTATGTITVYQSPGVEFSAGASSVCLPAPVGFSSGSIP